MAYLTYKLLELEQIEAPVKHIFAPGVYIRELLIPAGSLFTGNEHKLGHEVQLLEGSCLMVIPEGRIRFDAFASIHTKPGYHAVVAAITDMVARTVHPNPQELRDISALESIWFGNPKDLIARGGNVHKMLELEKYAA